MGRYNFVSPGAMAGNAIQEFLVQREIRNRQQMLADLEKKAQADAVAQQEKDRALREQQLALQQQQESRVAAAQQATIDDLANQREFGQVERAVEGARPDDAPLDPAMVEKVQRQGFGSRLRQMPGVLMQGPIEIGDQMSEADREAELGRGPEQTGLRPGSRFLDAEANRDAIAEQGRLTREAAGERASERAATERMLAQMRIDASKGNAEIGNYLKMLEAKLLEGKVDAAASERDNEAKRAKAAKDAAQRTTQDTLDLIGQLTTVGPDGKLTLKGGTANLFGAQNPLARMVPGSETNVAKSALSRLRSRSVLDLLGEMKAQSKTGASGFGALTGPELAILENAANQLNSGMISDETALGELQRIYDIARRARGDNSTPTDSTGGGVEEWIRDPATGKLRRK